MNTQTFREFKTRLAQTIAWCASRADTKNPETCLRTPELRPRLLEENRFSAVDTVVRAREATDWKGMRDATIPSALGGGKLLIYFPDSDLACGAAEQQTDGFFDVNNVPPWDTWVSYWQDEERNVDAFPNQYLIAWIPPAFVALAHEGISVNPEQCIMWLDETSVELAASVKFVAALAK